ncbi:MAG: response regulator [Gammaproteobacteria bacterium]|jgi:excisionase family DNA binding protein|nr:response regulator [Gammaproteobacteria bacterium]
MNKQDKDPPGPLVSRAYCTTSEAARLLGISVRAAQLWSERGILEGWKTRGGHRRISRVSVERNLAAAADAGGVQTGGARDALTILVVEDEPALLRLYEREMRKWPMQPKVVTARNGIEALVKLGMARPDLLVADLHMPDMDGFRMLEVLRGMPELQGMTTIVVSGLPPEQIAARGAPLVGIPILPKPIPFERLRDIATVLADRKARDLPG